MEILFRKIVFAIFGSALRGFGGIVMATTVILSAGPIGPMPPLHGLSLIENLILKHAKNISGRVIIRINAKLDFKKKNTQQSIRTVGVLYEILDYLLVSCESFNNIADVSNILIYKSNQAELRAICEWFICNPECSTII